MVDILIMLFILSLMLFSLLLQINTVALVFTIFSVIVYIYSLKRESGKLIFANIRFMFIIFLFLYANSYPIVKKYFSSYIEVLSYLPVSDVAIENGMLLSNLFIMTYIGLSIGMKAFKASDKDMFEDFFSKVKTYLINLEMKRFSIIFDILAMVMAIYYIINIYDSGLLNLAFSGIDRFQLIEILENTNHTHWIFTYCLIAYSCVIYTLAFNKLRFNNSKSRIIIVRIIIISIFWIINMLLGNRRDISYILLYLLFYYIVTREKKLSFLKLVFVILSGLTFSMIGYLRSTGFSFSNGSIDNIVNNSLGEFFVPINIFYYYLSNKIQLLYGASYFSFIQFVIPRAMWVDKPLSLAVNFANNFGGIMGYGFNPIAEGYINFGFMFIFILPIIIILLIKGIEALSKKYIPVYIFAYMQVMNFNRSEFSSSLIEFVIIYLTFTVMVKPQRKTIMKENT